MSILPPPLDVKAYDTHSDEEKSKKIKLALAGLAVIGAAAVGIALYVKKGKSSLKTDVVKDNVQKIESSVKKFFNEAGEAVEGARLEKGRALTADGSAFSGIVETVNKKGEQITLKYADGNIAESLKDGKLLKSFEKLSSFPRNDSDVIKYTRQQGAQIIEYNNFGTAEKITSHLYDGNGKIRRSITGTVDEYNKKVLDFKNGRLSAKSVVNGDGLLNGEVYNNKGEIIRTVKRANGNCSVFDIADIKPDGARKVTRGRIQYDQIDTPATSYVIKNPTSIDHYDSGNKLQKSVRSDVKGSSGTLELSELGKDGVETSCYIDIAQKGSFADQQGISSRFDLMRGDDAIARGVIDNNGKNTAKMAQDKSALSKLEEAVKSLMQQAKAEGMEFPYDKADEYLPKIYNT